MKKHHPAPFNLLAFFGIILVILSVNGKTKICQSQTNSEKAVYGPDFFVKASADSNERVFIRGYDTGWSVNESDSAVIVIMYDNDGKVIQAFDLPAHYEKMIIMEPPVSFQIFTSSGKNWGMIRPKPARH